MRPGLIDLLDKRLAMSRSNLEIFARGADPIEEGLWRAGTSGGRWFPIIGGVPCFLPDSLQPDLSAFYQRHGITPPAAEFTATKSAQDQALTTATFSDKWGRFRNYGLDPNHRSFLFDWYCKKLGKASQD